MHYSVTFTGVESSVSPSPFSLQGEASSPLPSIEGEDSSSLPFIEGEDSSPLPSIEGEASSSLSCLLWGGGLPPMSPLLRGRFRGGGGALALEAFLAWDLCSSSLEVAACSSSPASGMEGEVGGEARV